MYKLVILGGVMVSMVASRPKVRGFRPGQAQWIFKGDSNPQHFLLLRGVKLSAPCRKILRHIKDPCGV
jgi:hypothetical protein